MVSWVKWLVSIFWWCQLKDQSSDIDRVVLLGIVSKCAAESSFHFTWYVSRAKDGIVFTNRAVIFQCCWWAFFDCWCSDMAVGITQTASSVEEVTKICEMLRPCVVDPHRLVLLKCAVERVKVARRVLQSFAGIGKK